MDPNYHPMIPRTWPTAAPLIMKIGGLLFTAFGVFLSIQTKTGGPLVFGLICGATWIVMAYVVTALFCIASATAQMSLDMQTLARELREARAANEQESLRK